MPDRDSIAKGYRRSDGMVTERLDNEIFVLDPKGGRIHALNPTAAAIWQLLLEPATFNELVDDFSSAFPQVPRAKLAREIERGLASIEERDLVVRADDLA